MIYFRCCWKDSMKEFKVWEKFWKSELIKNIGTNLLGNSKPPFQNSSRAFLNLYAVPRKVLCFSLFSTWNDPTHNLEVDYRCVCFTLIFEADNVKPHAKKMKSRGLPKTELLQVIVYMIHTKLQYRAKD